MALLTKLGCDGENAFSKEDVMAKAKEVPLPMVDARPQPVWEKHSSALRVRLPMPTKRHSDPSAPRQVFLEADTDLSGKIDTQELDELLKKLGVKSTVRSAFVPTAGPLSLPLLLGFQKEELEEMIKDADEDGDGLIDPTEWNQIVFGLMGRDSDGNIPTTDAPTAIGQPGGGAPAGSCGACQIM
jgi:hypothetical protein